MSGMIKQRHILNIHKCFSIILRDLKDAKDVACLISVGRVWLGIDEYYIFRGTHHTKKNRNMIS